MRVIGLIMRFISFVFHLVLTLFMMGVAAVAWLSGNGSVRLGMLPWTGTTLNYVLFFGGLLGLALTVLAFFRTLPFLFVLWNLAVVVMLVRGYFFSSFSFGLGGGSVSFALYLIAAAAAALVGSLTLLFGSPRNALRYQHV